MATYFFDSSALVKRYVPEIGTSWVTAVLNPAAGNRIRIARVTAVEVTSAFFRRVRMGSVSRPDALKAKQHFDLDFISVYRIIEITPAILDQAVQFAEKHELRAYDAVQLAAATVIQSQRILRKLSPITLVASDQELLIAARAEGVPTDDPQNHP